MDSWQLKWSGLYEYTPANVSQYVSNISGVYRLSYQSVDGDIYVFYVGKAEDLQSRLYQHLLPIETNQCIKKMVQQNKCYFRYAMVNDDEIRSGAELALYLHYKPQCNSQTPEGSIIQINFE